MVLTLNTVSQICSLLKVYRFTFPVNSTQQNLKAEDKQIFNSQMEKQDLLGLSSWGTGS